LKYVDENLPGVCVTNPNATYLMWLDCSGVKLKLSPYEFFLKEAKVALSDGGKFGKGNEQFVRLNFGTSSKLLKQGLERIRKALN
jgi:cysteine-S-conjugate beta-lyase